MRNLFVELHRALQVLKVAAPRHRTSAVISLLPLASAVLMDAILPATSVALLVVLVLLERLVVETSAVRVVVSVSSVLLVPMQVPLLAVVLLHALPAPLDTIALEVTFDEDVLQVPIPLPLVQPALLLAKVAPLATIQSDRQAPALLVVLERSQRQ